MQAVRPKPEEWITREKAVGMKFGRLTIIEVMAPTDKKTRRHPIAGCFCDCGTICFKRLNNVTQGLTRSCGCMATPRRNPSRVNPRHRTDPHQPVPSMKHINAALDAMLKTART